MALETGTTIGALVSTNPVATDPVGQADDHLRLIKAVLKTTFGTITTVLDEDNMSTDSATALATQQSIKAYVDAQVTASDLDFQGDSGGALSIDLDSETLTVAGGTGIDTSGSSNTLTVAIDSTVATLTGSQVLTNKTLTSPVLNTAVSGTAILDEDDLSSDSATQLATQQSIKAYVDAQVTAQDLDLTSDSGTIAIDLDSETLTVAGGTGIDSSATSNTVTLAIDSTVVTLAGSQTLTNKTLTSPTLNTPTIGTSFTIGSATITEAELEVLAGATLTTTELNFVDGVTSAIQTQLDAKAPIATPTFTTSITIGSATISEAELEILDGATLTTAELNVLDGITSTVNELNILDGVTSTSTELNIMDGDTAASSTTLADADRVVVNDAGTMKQVALTDFETYFETSLDTLSNVTSVGTLTSLTISGDLTVDTNTLKVDSSNNRVGINQASPDVSFDAGSNTDAVHLPTGTTAQRPGSPAAGYFRYNSELSQFEGYTDEWGQIGGGGGSNTFQTDTFTTANDSTTDFTLSQAVEEADCIVFVDGVFQAHNAYSISGTTLTLSAAPASGRVVTAYSVKSAVGGSNFSIATMTGDNSDVTLTLPVNAVHKNNVHIMWDGVTQSKANYDIDAAGTTVTFTTAPPTGVHVEAIVATATSISTAAQLVDADSDTKIQVEESSDEDTIRMDIAGTEVLTLTNSAMTLKGTTPTLTIGDAGAEDTKIVFDGNAQDYYIGLDDSADDLVIGLGSAVGTTPAISIANQLVTIPKLLTLNNPESVQAKFNPNNDSFAAVAEFYNGTSSSNPLVVGQGYANGTDNIAYVWNRANAELRFGTNNTERMSISSTGTTTFQHPIVLQSGATQGLYIENNAGNATTPRITNDANDHTVIRPGKSAGAVQFNNFANDAELMRLTDAGNLGLGTGSAAGQFHIYNSVAGAQYISSSNSALRFVSTGGANYIQSGTATSSSSAADLIFTNVGGSGEVMRIDSAGDVIIGDTSVIRASSQTGVSIEPEGRIYLSRGTGTGGFSHLVFYNGNETVGTVTSSGSGTSYNESSDYRLKENVVYDWEALPRLAQLKPARFNFKVDRDSTVDGFVAHEAQTVVPEAVTGTHNETEDVSNAVLNALGNVIDEGVTEDEWKAGKEAEEGEEPKYAADTVWKAEHTKDVYQGIDKSKLVPLMVKAIQEQQTLIETLQTKVKALEEA